MNFSQIALCLLCQMILVSSCLTGGEKYISKREPVPVMATNKVPVIEAPKIEESKPRELFVRQKEIKIRRNAPVNETGSLTDLNDPRAYLFGFERPLDVGSFIDVKIESNRGNSKTSSNKDSAAASTAASDEAAPAPADGTAAKGDDSKNLLKSLPNLEPLDGQAALMTSMKMQIMERFDNGDVLVMHRRRSMRDGQASEVVVTSRLPVSALSRQDQVSTNDLVDVDWRESFDGELAERKSANWEDEYTYRLSGFEESKSKRAKLLDENREQLKSAREKLEKDMKLHLADRDKMTKERAALLDEKAKASEKIAELEAANSDLKKQLDSADTNGESKNSDKKADAKLTDKKPDEKKPAEKKSDAKKADAKK